MNESTMCQYALRSGASMEIKLLQSNKKSRQNIYKMYPLWN